MRKKNTSGTHEYDVSNIMGKCINNSCCIIRIRSHSGRLRSHLKSTGLRYEFFFESFKEKHVIINDINDKYLIDHQIFHKCNFLYLTFRKILYAKYV